MSLICFVLMSLFGYVSIDLFYDAFKTHNFYNKRVSLLAGAISIFICMFFLVAGIRLL